MSDYDLEKMRKFMHAHASVVQAVATMKAMGLENDERRSKGKSDAYPSSAFWEIERKIEEYRNALAQG